MSQTTADPAAPAPRDRTRYPFDEQTMLNDEEHGVPDDGPAVRAEAAASRA